MSFKGLLLISLSLTTFVLTKAATITGRSPSYCTGTINSLSGKKLLFVYNYIQLIPLIMMADVSNAVKCTTVILNGFTVPAGQALVLPLLDGTTVNMCKVVFSTCAK